MDEMPETDETQPDGSPAEVEAQNSPSAARPYYRFPFMGLGRSGDRDTAARAKEILRAEWADAIRQSDT